MAVPPIDWVYTYVSDKLTRRGRTNILIKLITDIMLNNNYFDIYIAFLKMWQLTLNPYTCHKIK